jgi:RNA methyltransferase, TrmH family
MAIEAAPGDSARRFLHAVAAEECGDPGGPGASRLFAVVPEINAAEREQPARSRTLVSGADGTKGALMVSGGSGQGSSWFAFAAASNERALRDLLLRFPSRDDGVLFLSGPWMLATVRDIFAGEQLPDRVGYLATADSFTPVPAPTPGQCGTRAAELRPLPGGLHQLRVTEDPGCDIAALTGAVGLATQKALARGAAAVVAPVSADQSRLADALKALGYQPFCRLPAFRGGKRGAASGGEPRDRCADAPGDAHALPMLSKESPLVHRVRALKDPEGRRAAASYVAEGLTLVERAITDGLPVESLLCRRELLASPGGTGLLDLARHAEIRCFHCSDGLMGTITSTRPLPAVIAPVHHAVQQADALRITRASAFLAVEDLHNPDNLGMVIRTADAAGIDAVVVTRAGVDPLHKNCVRAARGAVGRVPLYTCADLAGWLHDRADQGFSVLGATAHGDADLYAHRLTVPVVIVVGNEEIGLAQRTLSACTTRVRIPMAAGQSSLNVGVAAGILLYELVRQRACHSDPVV